MTKKNSTGFKEHRNVFHEKELGGKGRPNFWKIVGRARVSTSQRHVNCLRFGKEKIVLVQYFSELESDLLVMLVLVMCRILSLVPCHDDMI